MRKNMTIREIAELCEVDKTTVQRWAQKTDDAIRIEIDAKCRRALDTKEESRFTLVETLAIIRAGGKNTLAALLEENATKAAAKPAPRLTGSLVDSMRRLYGPVEAGRRIDQMIGYQGPPFVGPKPVAPRGGGRPAGLPRTSTGYQDGLAILETLAYPQRVRDLAARLGVQHTAICRHALRLGYEGGGYTLPEAKRIWASIYWGREGEPLLALPAPL